MRRSQLSRVKTSKLATYPQEVLADMRSLICGEKIGSGAFREVFEHAYNPRWVVKVQIEDPAKGAWFHNAAEWEVWHEIKETPYAKWFAPCHHISAFGLVLIQSKCEPIKKTEFPKLLPDFFGDVGLRNWGMLKGKPVCIDYGFNRLAKVALRKTRMVKPRV